MIGACSACGDVDSPTHIKLSPIDNICENCIKAMIALLSEEVFPEGPYDEFQQKDVAGREMFICKCGEEFENKGQFMIHRRWHCPYPKAKGGKK